MLYSYTVTCYWVLWKMKGKKMHFVFSCEGELLVMKDETWLEFWDLGQVEYVSVSSSVKLY